ncbi:olfactory receptor 1-like [Bufo bufo]|uniref:olfactory receptor 1-like n=1 Tax=Bufo bufo TaxID=8384 RepID=UPI001ABEAF11|nr:olfactory receptor 1-like [Bufo bufo]
MNECPNNTTTYLRISAFSTSELGQFLIYVNVLLIYLITVTGNFVIFIVICLLPQLHTPMYFFLSNLSMADVIYVSSTLPKLMSIIATKDNRVTLPACITQVFFFITTAFCDILILTSMSYDRYVAICIPLNYSMIMNRRTYVLMAAFTWMISFMNALMHSSLVSTLSFCSSITIDHFFCDLNALYAVTTSDTRSRKILVIIEDILFGFVPFSLIVTSYVFIISSILKIRSTEGRFKAFSSCTSHLTTVILFYGPILFLYIKPKSVDSKTQDGIISLLYVAVVPMLNPFVYTLRNKEFFGALKNMARINMATIFCAL